jgi:UDPglucose 6-dehydrogenase
MRITLIGAGYVGLVSGACFAELGHDVVCVDQDADRVERLRRGVVPIHEPDLAPLVRAQIEAGRLAFTTVPDAAVATSEVVLIAVGTPTRRGGGAADVSAVEAAARSIAVGLAGPIVVVTKSTVPVGTGDAILRILQAARPDVEVSVAANPEFLRAGAAVEDFRRPDRVVCGVEDERAREVLGRLYAPLGDVPLVFTSRRTAELIKYAANAFLATRVAFIDEIADLCEQVGADALEVAHGIGLDPRIGGRYLAPGPGFGGSCLPKDARALAAMGRAQDTPLRVVEAVLEANGRRREAMVDRIVTACGGDVAGKRIAVLGVTFKPNTDDMRDAPSLVVVPGLQQAGAEVHAHDPQGTRTARELLAGVVFHDDPYGAIDGADALVVLTAWDAFRALDLDRVKDLLDAPVVVDLRNVYAAEQMAARGFVYEGVGRG